MYDLVLQKLDILQNLFEGYCIQFFFDRFAEPKLHRIKNVKWMTCIVWALFKIAFGNLFQDVDNITLVVKLLFVTAALFVFCMELSTRAETEAGSVAARALAVHWAGGRCPQAATCLETLAQGITIHQVAPLLPAVAADGTEGTVGHTGSPVRRRRFRLCGRRCAIHSQREILPCGDGGRGERRTQQGIHPVCGMRVNMYSFPSVYLCILCSELS